MKTKLCASLLALVLAAGCLWVPAAAFASPESETATVPDASLTATEPSAENSGHVELEIGKDLAGEEAITFTYGEKKTLTLDITNVGDAAAINMKITPVVSNDVASFPFKITNAFWEEAIVNTADPATLPEDLTTADLGNAASGQNKGLVSFEFDVRKDAPSGYYPLRLTVEYQENGAPVAVEALLYVKVVNATLAGSTHTEPATAPAKKPESTPRLIVSGFTTAPEKVMAGEPFTLELTLTNTSEEVTVSNMRVAITSDDEGVFLPVSGSSTVFIREMEPGASETISMEMNTKTDLAPQSYGLSVKVDYEGKDAAQYSTEDSVSIPVHQTAKLTLSDITLVPEAVTVGESANLMVNLYNMGRSRLSNVLVKLESGGTISGEDFFAGNMEPGSTSTMDVMITPQTAGTLTCRLIVSYEDEMGQSYSEEKSFELLANSPPLQTPESSEGEALAVSGAREGSAGPSPWLIWTILSGIVVIAGGVAAVILLRRRNKKHIRRNMDHYLDQPEDGGDHDESGG